MQILIVLTSHCRHALLSIGGDKNSRMELNM